ncbi:thioredoxin family protein [Anaerobacillus sp. CMMVII]|uniref:thioredoxin family protein n=1 Tax=Anaerobacillus sp. CMMVII TaxID=2755588 RepID=UPI0021B84166|nr:thioredoxin family protein [Anaerobacillus sp. CMMVII]MCT8138457.1 thioredoxin family protein [Anaerobacillus sp. CMMVII]
MVEVTEKMIDWHLLTKKDTIKIYFCYTPLCGTCKLAKQMLEIWNQKYSNTTIYSVNINVNRNLAMKWQIKSVPYLAVFVNGLKAHEFYAFHSLETLNAN